MFIVTCQNVYKSLFKCLPIDHKVTAIPFCSNSAGHLFKNGLDTICVKGI